MRERNFAARLGRLCLAISIVVGVAAGAGAPLSGPAVAQSAEESLTEKLGEIFRDAFRGSGDGEQPAPRREQPGAAQPAPQPEATGPAGDRAAAEQPRQVPQSRQELMLSFSPLVKATAPAVVNVYADRTVVRSSPFEDDPFFERFFGRSLPNRTQKQSSLGSGVIVEKSGIVVTNNHVISGADEIRVALSDGREFESNVLLKDERFDLAVLKIKSEESFPVVGFGDSDALEVGDLVLAIGNPFGVGQTVTSGIVSALARNRIGVSDFGFFIQTDAAINPGNSGGALIDMNGDLIGINTAIFSRSGGSNGIGFAIPANLVRAFALSAESGKERFNPPYIGATFEPVTAEIADALALPRTSGALVSNVEEDGPAAKAGLRAGDVVTGFNGQAIEHPEALGYRLATISVGDTVELSIIGRNGPATLQVTVSRTPEGKLVRPVAISGDNPFSGVMVTPLDAEIARELRVPPDLGGVVITDVDRTSPGAQYGFRPRDIILEVNGRETTDPQSLQAALDEGGYFIRFELIRNGRRIRQMFNR